MITADDSSVRQADRSRLQQPFVNTSTSEQGSLSKAAICVTIQLIVDVEQTIVNEHASV